MYSYAFKRVLQLLPTLVGIVLLVFAMIHMVPGDPAQIMLGERADAASVAALRIEMGLDRPLYVQLYRFITDLLHLDLGRSLRTHEKITTEIAQRFPATCELTAASMTIAVLGGTLAGLVAAARRGRWPDFVSMIAATAGISMPIFWLGLLLILLLAVYFPFFPVSGRLAVATYFTPHTHFYLIDTLLNGDLKAFADVLWHLCLPAMTLSTVPMAVIARMTRSSLLEVLSEDYIRTAWSKGLSERAILLRHACKNAFIPTLTVVAMQFGYLLGGAVITETIFSWPGMGRWLFVAVQARDFRAVQGGVILLATVFVFVNLLADLLYAWLDPRIRYNR